jgi:hypothetical protein
MGKKSESGSRLNNPDHISESLETIFLGLKYLNSLMRIWDGKNSDPGSGINIPDPQTLLKIPEKSVFWKKFLCVHFVRTKVKCTFLKSI